LNVADVINGAGVKEFRKCLKKPTGNGYASQEDIMGLLYRACQSAKLNILPNLWSKQWISSLEAGKADPLPDMSEVLSAVAEKWEKENKKYTVEGLIFGAKSTTKKAAKSPPMEEKEIEVKEVKEEEAKNPATVMDGVDGMINILARAGLNDELRKDLVDLLIKVTAKAAGVNEKDFGSFLKATFSNPNMMTATDMLMERAKVVGITSEFLEKYYSK
jgi:hypothetical protein